MKNFDTAARRGTAAVVNPVDITFAIDDVKFTAHPPTTGQLALFIMSNTEGGTEAMRAMFDFLAAIMDDEGVEAITEKLQEGVELTLITDIISYLIEEWSARPTSPSSASSGSRRNTTKRSTAKRPAKAKTPST